MWITYPGDAPAVLGAVAALTGTGAAWFTYFAAVRQSQKAHHEGLRNVLQGIRQELRLIELWAGKDESDGYLEAKSKKDYQRDHADWSDPGRLIWTFDYPTIKHLTQSQYARRMQPILDSFVIINYSIVRLYDAYQEYRAYVTSRSHMFDTVMEKVITSKTRSYTEEERIFLLSVFEYNYLMHVKLIGGRDSKNSTCLYHAYRNAKKALEDFESKLKPEKLSRAFWIFHIVASMFLLLATLLFCDLAMRIFANYSILN